MKVFIRHNSNNKASEIGYFETSFEELVNMEDASCMSIDMNDSLDFMVYEDRNKAIDIALSKLRYDGDVILSGVDVISISDYLRAGRITIPHFNSVITNRISVNSMFNMMDKIIELDDMSIELAKADGINYLIRARRNGIK